MIKKNIIDVSYQSFTNIINTKQQYFGELMERQPMDNGKYIIRRKYFNETSFLLS